MRNENASLSGLLLKLILVNTVQYQGNIIYFKELVIFTLTVVCMCMDNTLETKPLFCCPCCCSILFVAVLFIKQSLRVVY